MAAIDPAHEHHCRRCGSHHLSVEDDGWLWCDDCGYELELEDNAFERKEEQEHGDAS